MDGKLGEIFKQQTGSEGSGCCIGKEGFPTGHQSGRGGCLQRRRAGSGSGFGEHADEAHDGAGDDDVADDDDEGVEDDDADADDGDDGDGDGDAEDDDDDDGGGDDDDDAECEMQAVGRRTKECTYPEIFQSRRCDLVVLAIEVV